MSRPPLRVLVVGGGVAGLLHAQLVLDRSETDGREVDLVWAVLRDGSATASRSGGLALRYASPDPRAVGWSAASPAVGLRLADRHPVVAAHLGTTRALLVSDRAPLAGYAGDVVRPADSGLAHAHGLLAEPGPLWHTCGLLPRWAEQLAADPRVRRVTLAEPLASTADLVDLHTDSDADVTLACLGLGAHTLGDRSLAARLGVLLTGPLPPGLHAEHAVIDDDDEEHPSYTVPHATAGKAHLHVGGTYLPVDDPAAWDEPSLLAARARATAPRVLAAAKERFPALAEWRPDGAGAWWGLRPVRPEVALGRLEERAGGHGGTVVVAHGWGGSGWTIGPAAADEVAAAVVEDRLDELPVWER
ncbi:FAD-dependent oxidoreductase [Aquipuribacter sp. SD81]|uniref:FAD-dependent oxidoreductase n=1 Tax=Aquipuribacter sp. SD81 TaxID=3127703 RepID=UPI00301955EE